MTLGRAYIEIVGDVSKFAPGLRKNLQKAFTIGSVGTVAAAASAQLIGLAGAMAQTAGAAVAIPAAIGVGAAAIGALKLATSGLGDAFAKAAGHDAKAFEKALEGLSPKAQTLAREVRAVKPVLDQIHDAAQDAFSAQLLGQVSATAAVLAGPLSSGLARIASEYGNAARQALVFAREAGTVAAVTRLLDATRVMVANLAVAVRPLLAGFRDLSVIALPVLEALSTTAGQVAARFGAWLSAMAQSGAAAAMFQQAVMLLGQLGQVAANVGGILMRVFAAASQTSGSSLVSSLVAATGALNTFLASAQGHTALVGLFTTLSQLSGGLAPVLTTLLGIVANLVPALGAIAQSVVPALQALATGLAPALAALAPAAQVLFAALGSSITALAPALAPIAQVIAALVTALAPLLPVVARVVAMLVGPLAVALNALGPLITPLVGALGPVLLQIGQTLTTVLAPVARLLVDLFTRLGPPLGEIVTTFGTALGPVLAALGPLASTLVQALTPLIPVVLTLLGPVTQIIVALAPLITLMAQVVTLLVAVAAPLIKLTAALLQVLAAKAVVPLLGLITDAITWLLTPLTKTTGALGALSELINGITWAGVGAAIGGAFATAWEAVRRFFADLGRWFADLPTRIGGFLADLPTRLVGALRAAFGAALTAAGVGIGLLVYAVTDLPRQVVVALSQLPGMLTGFLTGLATTVVGLVTTTIDALLGMVIAIPQRTAAALLQLPTLLGGILTTAWAVAATAVTTGVNAIVGYVMGMPARLAALAGGFWSAGQNLIQGFMNGFRTVGSFVGDIAGAINNAVKGFLNKVIGKINSSVADLDNVLPGTLPRIPYLAQGALLNRPTLAMLGEAGPEVVIPLTRPKRARELAEASGLTALLGGGGVTFARGAVAVTFSGVVPTEAEARRTGQAVGDGIAATLARRDIRTTVRTI